MERGLSSLLRLMSSSWVFIGAGSESVKRQTDPTDEGDQETHDQLFED